MQIDGSPSLPPLADMGGRLILSAEEKPFLFSAHFDAKQFRDSFQQPHSYGPSPVQCSVAFMSSSIRRLLRNLNPNGGNDPDGKFPLFYKQLAWEQAPKLAVIFRHLVKGGCFPACWRLADVVSNIRGRVSFLVCWLILITAVLSKVFEKIVAGKLSHYLESNSLLSLSQFSFRWGLGTCDALLTLSHHLQALIWTGAWREGSYSWTSWRHLIGLVTVVCFIS